MTARLGWKSIAAISLAWLLLFTVLLREDWVATAVITERDRAEQALGSAVTIAAIERAASWHDAVLVDSGVLTWAYALFTLPATERARDADFGTAAPWFDAWFERRLAALFALADLALLRASLAAPWLPAGLLPILPCVLDGLMRRQIKRSTFDYCSPLLYRGGIAVVEVIGMALLLAPFTPWALPTFAFPSLLLLFACACAAIVANVQKDV